MNLSIIIINWNSVKFLKKCLQSIYENINDLELELVVLDNASFDGCREMISREFPDVLFIQSDKNLGFAQGNNLAASCCRGEAFLFLNPDTEIHGAAIRILYNYMNSLPYVGTLGGRLLNSDGSIQTSCLQAFPTITNKLLESKWLQKLCPKSRLWGMAPLFAENNGPKIVEGISGACLMTPKEVFKKVGGFSENYFMYFEDMDYCLKVFKSGLKNYYVSSAEIIHHGGKSSGGGYNHFANVMMADSSWRYFKKQKGFCYALIFRMGLCVKAFLLSLFFAIRTIINFKGNNRDHIKGRMRKWTSLLGWCLGIEKRLGSYR
jgi:N-acetylglucosaminyl-diphospho-decaprenol L-rhamnosyltransferase